MMLSSKQGLLEPVVRLLYSIALQATKGCPSPEFRSGEAILLEVPAPGIVSHAMGVSENWGPPVASQNWGPPER